MAQATAPVPTGIPSSVSSKLRRLRMNITAWLLVDGLSRVMLCLVALIAIDFAIDWLVSLDRAQRVVMLVLCGGALAYVAYVRVLVPLWTSVSDEALCLAVERHYGRELNESLISAVQFSQLGGRAADGVSPQLVRATIEQGTRAAERIPFGSVVDRRWFVANLGLLAACGVLLGGFGYAAAAFRDNPEYENTNYQLAEIWFDRDILLQDRAWPQDTYLLVPDAQGRVLTIPRGDSWTIAVAVKEESKRKPNEVLIDFLMDNGARHTETMKPIVPERPTAPEADGQAESSNSPPPPLRFEIERASELEPFQFQARAGGFRGAKTGWFQVRLLDRPEVDELTLTATAPRYAAEHIALAPVRQTNEKTGEEETHYWEGTVAEVAVKEGDRIQAGAVLVKLNTDEGVRPFASPLGGVVKRLYVQPGDEAAIGTRLATLESVIHQLPPGTGPHQVLMGSSLQIAGTANKPLSKAVLTAGEGESLSRHDMAVADGRFSIMVPAAEFAGGGYRIDLWDQEEVMTPGADAPGPLQSRRPARFTLRAVADRAPDVVAKLDGISGMVVPRAVVKYDAFIKDEFAITDVQLKYQWRQEDDGSSIAEGSRSVGPAKARLGEKTMKFADALDLAPLEIPPGSALSFYISAWDNNDISGPSEGKSTVFLLRVVSEGELRDELVRRQIEQRQDFERLFKSQQDLKTDAEVLQAESEGNDALTPEQRQTLLALQKNQKLISTNIQNIANRLQSIAREIENNRLDESDAPLLEKLEKRVIRPMRELAEQDVPEISRQLDNTRYASEKPQERSQALDDAIARQDDAVEKMREVLKNMAQTEGYQEAVNLLYEIEKMQKVARELTEKEKQKLVEDFLEGDGSPEGDSADEEEKSDDPS